MRAVGLERQGLDAPGIEDGHGERAWPSAIKPHAPQPRRGQDKPRPAARDRIEGGAQVRAKTLDGDRQGRLRPVLDQNGPGCAELRDRALDRDVSDLVREPEGQTHHQPISLRAPTNPA